MTSTACPTYRWCEIDHESPEWAESADFHMQHVQVSELEDVVMCLEGGEPSMDWVVSTSEVWTDPDRSPRSFLEMRDAIDHMIAEWSRFLAETTATLKRDVNQTRELAERDV